MFIPVCVHTTGLASPSALQSPVASKSKNGSLAISKPQEGQPYFSIPLHLLSTVLLCLLHARILRLPVMSHCCHVEPFSSFSWLCEDWRAQLLLQSDLDLMAWLCYMLSPDTQFPKQILHTGNELKGWSTDTCVI